MLLLFSSVFTWASWDRESDVNLQGTKDSRAANTEEAQEERKDDIIILYVLLSCQHNAQLLIQLQQLTRGNVKREKKIEE